MRNYGQPERSRPRCADCAGFGYGSPLACRSVHRPIWRLRRERHLRNRPQAAVLACWQALPEQLRPRPRTARPGQPCAAARAMGRLATCRPRPCSPQRRTHRRTPPARPVVACGCRGPTGRHARPERGQKSSSAIDGESCRRRPGRLARTPLWNARRVTAPPQGHSPCPPITCRRHRRRYPSRAKPRTNGDARLRCKPHRAVVWRFRTHSWTNCAKQNATAPPG